MSTSSVTAPPISASQPYAVPLEQVRHLVEVAALAPSVHNSQPWRFEARSDGLDLYADPTRRLDVLDPMGRLMHLSCGAALLNVRVAARALGLEPVVQLLPDGPHRDRLARVTLSSGRPAGESELALATAVLHRHTYRGRFEERPLGEATLGLLRHTAEREGAVLVSVARADDLVELEVLLARADSEELRSEAYRTELARWVRDDVSSGDGIPTGAVLPDSTRGSSVTLRGFLPDNDVPRPAGGAPPRAEHPAVVVLMTQHDDPPAWLAAGQALGAVLLQAADLGVLAQPLGQVTDLEGSRTQLAVALGLTGIPQLVLRMGYATGTAQTPRRAVDDVLGPR